MPLDLSHLGGWYDGTDLAFGDGGHRIVGATLPTFQDAAPGLMLATEPPKPILLYKAFKQVLGHYPPYKRQEIGSCVGHGHAHANDCQQVIEIAFGEPSEFRETSAEFVYALSRQVGGILGPFDGSYGSAAVKAMVTVGIASREMLGPDGVDSGTLAKRWGWSGPPSKYVEMARQFKLGGAAKITSIPAAVSALWNGHVITICSNQGFTMTRDDEGYCAGQGHWGHCMHITGYDPGFNRQKKRRFLIVQSWGENTPSGPVYMDQPNYSFWADAELVERNIFGADDSWTLIKSPDFVKRKMPKAWSQAA